MKIGERLTELREDKGITQLELSKKLHISNSSISAYETGACMPDVETLRSLAIFYDVTSDYLLGLTEESVSPAVLSEEFTNGVTKSTVLKMLETLSPEQRAAELIILENMRFYTEVTGKTVADGARK